MTPDVGGQTPADLRQLALSALHPCSRERFLALHDIAQGSCATEVAERTDRRPHTGMDWLHTDNEHGPEALMYRRTGPLFVQTSRLPSTKQQQMQWSKQGAHRLLQTRTLDGTLLDLFTTWYPAMAVNDYDGALSTVAA